MAAHNSASDESNELLQLQVMAVAAAANAIVITDSDGVIASVNPAFTRLTGFSAEEAIGPTGAHFRAVLYDQAGGPGDRARPSPLPRHRRGARRHPPGGEQGRGGDGDDHRSPRARAAGGGGEGGGSSARAPPGIRVLVVDDEPHVAGVLMDLFRAQGAHVEAVSGGREALERLERAEYDIILSDVRMPGLDGPALYKVLLPASASPSISTRSTA